MKRTPLPRRTSRLVRRARLRTLAAGEVGDWPPEVRTEVAARSGGRCEISLPECAVRATDMHHRRRRREGDHRAVNALHCCRPCHSWCHRNPQLAREAGWIVSAWADPSRVPVRASLTAGDPGRPAHRERPLS